MGGGSRERSKKSTKERVGYRRRGGAMGMGGEGGGGGDECGSVGQLRE